MNKFKKNHFKMFFVLLFCGLFVFNVINAKAMMSIEGIPEPDEDVKGVQVIIVSPPGVFTLPGSETSNFTQVCALGEALNIVLDVTGKNKIEFEGPIVDMCDNNMIKNMDDYVQMDSAGEVSVRSDLLLSLKNKSANITMRNLPFENEPDIEVDGKLATDKDIENKKWDFASKTLTFKAKHFTTYKAVGGKLESTKEVVKEYAVEDFISTKIIVLIVVIVLLIFGILFYFLNNRKQKK